MDLQPDTILHERYRIVRALGQGGMGAVHLAVDLSLDHEVAIKSNRGTSDTSKNQFIREARLLATLRHPNLPRVIDYFIVDTTQFLVMDYIPGDDLEKMRKEHGAAPFEYVMQWAIELGMALTYLHSQNPPVIHRDIKPANIKITPDGHAILVDFGIAKAISGSQMTTAGASAFTPGSAPPEQYGGARTGPYSDQYSLAATLYTLLSGQKPPESLSLAMNEAILTPLHEINPAIPKQVSEIIQRAMSVRPTDRFASVQEFLGYLQAWKTVPLGQVSSPAPGDATQVVAPATMPQAAPKAKRTWVLPCAIVAGILLLIAIAGGIGAYFYLKGTATAVAIQPTASEEILVEEEETDPTETSAPPSSTPTTEASLTPTITSTTPPESTETPAPILLGGGGTVAFVSDRADSQTFQIWTMKVYQTFDNRIVADDFTQVTFDAGDKHQPEWSPNGLRIAYSAPDPDGSGTQIFIVNVGGGSTEPLQLTNLDGENMHPAWSPDSNTIAFVNFGRYQPVYTMFFINVDGTNLRRVSLEYQEKEPVWSPDGQWLVYVITAETHEYLFIRSKTDDFEDPEQYDHYTHFGRLGEVANPSWSPNGAYIAYTRMDGSQNHVYLAEFATRGADLVNLTPEDGTASQPAWSPDSQYLLFTSERNNNSDIYIMTYTGLLQTNLTDNPARDQDADWE